MERMLQRYAIALALSIGWMLPFVHKAATLHVKPVVKDERARWGILLERIALGIMLGIPVAYVPNWRIALALVLGMIGIVTSWFAIRHLDKQWRLDAALNADHKLIQTGPYSFVRHPIYSAMFAMLLSVGLLLTHWWILFAGVLMFMAGTEIRVRAEERLLRSRFGEEFDAYTRRVPAYVPFVRAIT